MVWSQTAQVNLIGVLPQASFSTYTDLLREYDSGKYQIQFVYQNPIDATPVAFRFKVTFRHNGKVLYSATSRPNLYTPGIYTYRTFKDTPSIRFEVGIQDVINQLESKYQAVALRSGLIPEGAYELEIEPLTDAAILTTPAVGSTEILYPEPSVLVSPVHESQVAESPMTVAWTPVIGGITDRFQYSLYIVKILPNQSPLQALSSNPLATGQVIRTNQTTFVYSAAYPVLEEGATYAVRLKTEETSRNAPITRDGLSEIVTFTKSAANIVQDPVDPPGDDPNALPVWDQVALIPGFAQLRGLAAAFSQDIGSLKTLSGFAILRLEMPDGPKDLRVRLQNLQIQPQAIAIMGGQVHIDNAVQALGLPFPKENVQLQAFYWDRVQGFVVEAKIKHPQTGNFLPATGQVLFDATGFSGLIEATLPNPVVYENGPVKLFMGRLGVRLPGGETTGVATLSLFGKPTNCRLEGVALDNLAGQIPLSCRLDLSLSNAPDHSKVRLKIQQLTGSFSVDPTQNQLSTDLTLMAELGLLNRDGKYCGVLFPIRVQDQITTAQPELGIQNCDRQTYLETGTIDLFIVRMRLESFGFRDDFSWTYRLNFQAGLVNRLLGGEPFVIFPNLVFDGTPLQIPEIALSQRQLTQSSTFLIAPFEGRFSGFRQPPVLIDWLGMPSRDAGPWNAQVDIDLRFSSGLSRIPTCLQTAVFSVQNGQWNGKFFGWSSTLSELPRPCVSGLKTPELTEPMVQIVVEKLRAVVNVNYDDNDQLTFGGYAQPTGNIQLFGPLLLERGITIGGTNTLLPTQDLAQISLNTQGFWVSNSPMGDIVQQITVQHNGYSIRLGTAKVVFGEEDGRQLARFSGVTGEGELLGIGTVPVNVGLDLMTGRFDNWRIGATEVGRYRGRVAIPKTNPTAHFQAESIQFGTNSILINGRGTLLGVGTSNGATSLSGATFDEVILDPATHRILSGTITLDGSVEMFAAVDRQSGRISLSNKPQLPVTQPLEGLTFWLPASSQISSLGWVFPQPNPGDGAAVPVQNGEVRVGEFILTGLTAQASAELRISLSPLGIVEGEIGFDRENNRIATLDHLGLRMASNLASALLPDQIALPLESVSHLLVKTNGVAVISSEDMGNGLLRLFTLPGKKARWVLPALQGNQATPPVVELTFENLVYNPNTRQVTGGNLMVSVANRADLKLPESLSFTPLMLGFEGNKLMLTGRLALFGQTLGDACPIQLFTQTDQQWKVATTCNPDQFVPFLPGKGLAGMSLRSLNLQMTIPIQGGPFTYLITGEANIQIRSQSNAVVAAAVADFRYTHDGFSLSRFEPIYAEAQNLTVGDWGLRLSGIRNIQMDYRQEQFSFRMGLEAALWLGLNNGRGLEMPLNGVALTETGLDFPEIDLHEGTNPPLSAPYVNLGAFQVQAIGVRLAKTRINIFDVNPPNITPQLDLRIKPSGLADRAPELANQTLVIRNAGFEKGLLSGIFNELELMQEKPLALGGHSTLRITKLSGRLFDQNGVQEGEIHLKGTLKWPQVVENANDCETEITTTLRLSGRIEANVPNVPPCGTIRFGAVSLQFQQSALSLKLGNDEESFLLTGVAEALIENEGGAVRGNGNVVLNLLNGDLLAPTSIAINQPFTWHYPKNNPIFAFSVANASLTEGGLKLNGQGGVRVGGGTVNTAFNEAVFGLAGNVLQGGSIQISAPLAFQFFFDRGEWGITDANTPFPANGNLLKMGIPANVRITKDGMALSGEATAQLRIGSLNFPQLKQRFGPVVIGFGSVYVRDGKVEYFRTRDDGQEERVAYLDKDGFHPDNIGEAIADLIPEKLPVPTTSVAYIQLKQGSNLLIATENLGNGRMRIFTRPGQSNDLVFEGIAGKPSAKTAFSAIFNGASVEAFEKLDVEVTEALNQKLFRDTPLTLKQLRFQLVNGAPALLVDALVKLPKMLDRDAPLELSGLRLTERGFDNATLSLGDASPQFQQSCADSPLKKLNFGGEAVQISICGVSFTIQNNGFGGIALSGQLATSFFKDDAGKPGRFQLVGGYNNTWNFDVLVDPRFSGKNLGNSGEDIWNATGPVMLEGIPLGFADFLPSRIGLVNSDSEFALLLDGMFKMEKLLGKGFALGVSGLKIGTGGVSLTQAEFNNQQQTKFLGDQFPLLIRRMRLSIQNTILRFGLDGDLTFLGKTLPINNLVIGTDGSFSVGDAALNLLNPNDPISIIPNLFVFNTLKIGVENNRPKVTASGLVTLPEPFKASGEAGLTVALGQDGTPTFTPIYPTFDFGKDEPIAGAPEVDLGGMARLKLTGIKFVADWNDLSNTSIMASASLKFGNDDSKVIAFGSPADIDQNWGLKLSVNQGVQWRFPNAQFRFDVDAGVFKVTNLSIGFKAQNGFAVVIGGTASLNLAGSSGTFGYQGLTIGTNGIIDSGSPTGEVSVKLMEVVSLTLNGFAFSSSPTTLTLPTSSGGPSGVQQSTESIPVKYYLKAGATITIGDGLGGGVDEVLVYEKQNGGFFLSIKNAHLELGGIAKATASMQYLTDARGFVLRVAGGVEMAPGIGGALAGKIGVRDGKVTMGLFAKIDFPIEIFPGVLTLSSIGAGFFIRPEQADMELVMTLPGLREALYKPDRVPQIDGMDFTALLFAQIDVLKMVRGRALLAFSFGDGFEKFDFTLNANVTIFDLPVFQAGMYLNIHKEPNLFRMAGEVGAKLDFGFLLYAGAEVGFNLISQNGNTKWAIWGNVKARVLFVGMEGEFFVGDPGFLFKLSVDTGLSLAIVSTTVHFDFMVWWRSNGKNMGAYGELTAGIEVLGFELASVTAKGAFINRNNKTLFYAGARVKILFGKISIYLANYDGEWDGGLGSNSAYEAMIAEAMQDAENMKNEANQAQQALQAAIIAATFMSKEQLAASGANLLLLRPDQKQSLLDQNSDAWRYSAKYYRWAQRSYRPQAFTDVYNQVVSGQISEKFSSEDHYAYMMNASLTALKDKEAAIQARLEEIKAIAIESVKESEAMEAQIQSVQNPISDLNLAWQGDEPPSYQYDSAVDDQNRRSLGNLQLSIEAIEAKYRKAIIQVWQHIGKTEVNLLGEAAWMNGLERPADLPAIANSGNGELEENARLFSASLNNVYSYYSRRVAHIWSLRKTYQQRLNTLNGLAPAVLDEINSTTNTVWNTRVAMGVNGQEVGVDAGAMASILYQRMTIGTDITWNSMAENATTLNNAVRQYAASFDEGQFKENVNRIQREFWVERFQLGLERLIETTGPARIQNEISSFSTQRQNLLAPWHQFSSRIAEIHRLKSQMVVTLYGMVSDFATWRRSSNLKGNEPFQSLKTGLGLALQAPSISQINLLAQRNTNLGVVNLTWAAQHPISVSEYALSVSGGIATVRASAVSSQGGVINGGLPLLQQRAIFAPAINVAASYLPEQVMLSVGKNTSQNFETVRLLESEKVQTLNVTLQARGPAGNVTRRTVSFNVDVSEEGVVANPNMLHLGVVVPTGNGNLVSQDYTPPTIGAARIVAGPEVPQKNGVLDPETGVTPIWVNKPHRVTLSISASDLESDIKSFSYAIGSAYGQTDIQPWQPLIGVIDRTRNTSTILGEASGLNLQEDRNYYFSVVAENGQGLQAVNYLPMPVRLDLSPPKSPALIRFENNRAGAEDVSMPDPVIFPQVEEAELNNYARRGTAPYLYTQYQVEISNPRDVIRRYGYVVTSRRDSAGVIADALAGRNMAQFWYLDPPVRYVDRLEGETMTLNIQNTIPYADTRLLVFSEDFFGRRSPAMVVNLGETPDPTRPLAPIIRAFRSMSHGLSQVVFITTEASEDKETGVEACEYAIGTNVGLADVRAWGKIDCDRGDFGRFVIPETERLGFDSYYVSFRTLNGHKKTSGLSVVGPILLKQDASPPVLGEGRTVWDARAKVLQVSLELKDEESGVNGRLSYVFVYRKLNNLGQLSAQTYRTFSQQTWVGPLAPNEVDTKTFTVPLNINKDFIPGEIEVTVSNPLGLTRTFSIPIEQ